MTSSAGTCPTEPRKNWPQVPGDKTRIGYRLKPNTHRRRERDETVESRRVGVGGVYTNSRRLPTDSAMRTHNAADTTKLSPTSCEFVYTPPTPTRRDSTVSSRRRRRCVLGFNDARNSVPPADGNLQARATGTLMDRVKADMSAFIETFD